jgi:hypothetical protein
MVNNRILLKIEWICAILAVSCLIVIHFFDKPNGTFHVLLWSFLLVSFICGVSSRLTCSQLTLYRDTRKTHKTCTWTAKTAPCFVHSGCVPGLYPDSATYCSSLHAQQRLQPLLPGR